MDKLQETADFLGEQIIRLKGLKKHSPFIINKDDCLSNKSTIKKSIDDLREIKIDTEQYFAEQKHPDEDSFIRDMEKQEVEDHLFFYN